MTTQPDPDRPALDPGISSVLDAAAAAGRPPLTALTPEQNRDRVRAGNALCGGGPALARVADILCDGVACRLYEPDDAHAGALVYLHGGGWVTGDLDYADLSCRHLADALGIRVLSVDYRLAPEHPFPAAVEDASTGLRWADRELRGAGPLVVAGDSAGGALAAALTLRARDTGSAAISAQLLLYPVVDDDVTRPSYRYNAGAVLGSSEMSWFWDHYVPDPDDRHHPWAAPLRAASLAGLPPAVLLLAGYDPLLDEGRAYARALADAGVRVVVQEEPTMAHGFLRFAACVPAAVPALRSAAGRLRDLLGRP
jgi:acetyl esterase